MGQLLEQKEIEKERRRERERVKERERVTVEIPDQRRSVGSKEHPWLRMSE